MTAPLTIFKDKITCGTWTFNDPANLPAGVTQLGINILDGWDDTMPIQPLVTSRGARDGDVPSAHFPARSRTVTLSGWMYCTSRTAARLAWTNLVANAFPLDDDLILTRYEPDVAKRLTVRRSGQIELPPSTNLTGPHFRFLVPLLATDPLKYASTVDINSTSGVAGLSSGGVVVPVVAPIVFVATSGQLNQLNINNIGSYITRPVTTITGPLPTGWHYDNSTTGFTLGLDVSLGAGDSLVLDHAAETVMLNSVQISPAIVGTWWGLQPGPNVLKLFGNFDPAATVTVVGRSAWE
jgi:hypothetical protein